MILRNPLFNNFFLLPTHSLHLPRFLVAQPHYIYSGEARGEPARRLHQLPDTGDGRISPANCGRCLSSRLAGSTRAPFDRESDGLRYELFDTFDGLILIWISTSNYACVISIHRAGWPGQRDEMLKHKRSWSEAADRGAAAHHPLDYRINNSRWFAQMILWRSGSRVKCCWLLG